jgi:pyruvate dehydrogenase E2 component (dihydrolipoamide acetyltransferase)
LIAIRTPIAIIGDANEPIDHLENGSAASTEAANHAPSSDLLTRDLPQQSRTAVQPGYEQVLISPRARRYADEHGVAIASLTGAGTGPEGRVVERDVVAYLQATPIGSSPAGQVSAETGVPRSTPLAARIADELGIDLTTLAVGLPGSRVRSSDVLRHAESNGPLEQSRNAAPLVDPEQTIALAGMRKRIADNVAKSAFTAPHVTLTLEVDMTACAEFRKRALPEIEKSHGVRLSFTDILVKTVSRTLGEHRMLNATLAGAEIKLLREKNIGVAVALEEGLIVPVVKSADQKTLGTISAELKLLVDRARTGRFTPDDLEGGTFTISNLGAFGIDLFDPIIVTGQAAILGVGRIADKPVVIHGQVVVRSMMNLCLSFDHRILDGAPAARFLQRMKELLENPILILL